MTKATEVNGNKWKLIMWGTGVLLFLGGVIGTFAVLGSNVADMKPEVKKNSEHRVRFEEKVTTMEKNIELILDEVRK